MSVDLPCELGLTEPGGGVRQNRADEIAKTWAKIAIQWTSKLAVCGV